jgi:Reverse transcriptase (RNA-dependent DNA polymerase)
MPKTLATATVDRLLHHAHLIVTEGPSLRLAEATEGKGVVPLALVARDRGSPQGSAISPLLANLFMHYCFDSWMSREFPVIGFERYCDDIVVHCVSQAQAEFVKERIGQRLKESGLELNPEKTQIVYCKGDNRRGSHGCEKFEFLSYEFRARRVRTSSGTFFDGFNPAVSPKQIKRLQGEMRGVAAFPLDQQESGRAGRVGSPARPGLV